VLALRPSAQGDDEECRPPDLQEQVASDEQPRAVAERVVDRDGHQEAREHQRDERRAHRQPVRLEPVRPPRGHVPGVEDRERQHRGLGARAQVHVREQVVRDLPDREDVDEVEEQLERGDVALRAGRSRDGDPHRGDPTRGTTREPPGFGAPPRMACGTARRPRPGTFWKGMARDE
jgi:hypothetical protein